jgi:hypothetical protein
VFYYILTAYIVIDLVIAIILENIEFTDGRKKLIQKVCMCIYIHIFLIFELK